MKNIFIFFLLYLISIISYSQSYNESHILVSDIEKGIDDFNYLRTVLLEKGFRFDRKNSESEFWSVPLSYGSKEQIEAFNQITIQLTTWKNNSNKEIEKAIYIKVRKDLLPEYNSSFSNSIKLFYPEKTAELKNVIDPKTQTLKDTYILFYNRKGSKTKVKFGESDGWGYYDFTKKYN